MRNPSVNVILQRTSSNVLYLLLQAVLNKKVIKKVTVFFVCLCMLCRVLYVRCSDKDFGLNVAVYFLVYCLCFFLFDVLKFYGSMLQFFFVLLCWVC